LSLPKGEREPSVEILSEATLGAKSKDLFLSRFAGVKRDRSLQAKS
jgi:hypothetical protein